MLTKLLNLLPVAVVNGIGTNAFNNLQQRGAIRTWIVGYPPERELTYECRGLSVQLLELNNSWEWNVLDGLGTDIVESGICPTKEEAMVSAEVWIDRFLTD